MIFDLILVFDLPKKIIHGSMILLLDRWMDGKLYLSMVLSHVNLTILNSHVLSHIIFYIWNHNHDIEAYKIIMVINNCHLESYRYVWNHKLYWIIISNHSYDAYCRVKLCQLWNHTMTFIGNSVNMTYARHDSPSTSVVQVMEFNSRLGLRVFFVPCSWHVDYPIFS